MTPRAVIEICDLSKSFGENRVLDRLNLSVDEGTVFTILGASGSGKTVLLKHVMGLLKPDTGRVLVEGEDIVPMGPEELTRVRRKFGILFQSAALFDSMTVYENVSFPLREHSSLGEAEIARIVRAKLDLFGLGGTEGLRPSDLSGGMKKRVGLARAIVLDPKILLYDEPTSGLDPLTTRAVDEMILEAKTKLQVTSVVISHDIASTLRISDRIALLHQGRIVECAPPDQFRASLVPEVQAFLQGWREVL